MVFEKLMGKGKSCAPLGREIVENCVFPAALPLANLLCASSALGLCII
jgi:hypothetical protein